MKLYPDGFWKSNPLVDPSKFTKKTLDGIASFNRIVMNYLRMQRLDAGPEVISETTKTDENSKRQPPSGE